MSDQNQTQILTCDDLRDLVRLVEEFNDITNSAREKMRKLQLELRSNPATKLLYAMTANIPEYSKADGHDINHLKYLYAVLNSVSTTPSHVINYCSLIDHDYFQSMKELPKIMDASELVMPSVDEIHKQIIRMRKEINTEIKKLRDQYYKNIAYGQRQKSSTPRHIDVMGKFSDGRRNVIHTFASAQQIDTNVLEQNIRKNYDTLAYLYLRVGVPHYYNIPYEEYEKIKKLAVYKIWTSPNMGPVITLAADNL